MTSERLTKRAPVAVSQKLVRVQCRESDIAHAELQRHDKVHQADHQRHGGEKDHDRAVRREDLIEMLRRQIASGVKGDRLLRAHHQRIDKAAQQHQQREQQVHDPDAFVIDAGDPLVPQIRQIASDDDPEEDGEHGEDHDTAGDKRDRLTPGDRIPGELTKHVSELLLLGERPPRRRLPEGLGPAGISDWRCRRTGAQRPSGR
jgi:hypothetical protein